MPGAIAIAWYRSLSVKRDVAVVSPRRVAIRARMSESLAVLFFAASFFLPLDLMQGDRAFDQREGAVFVTKAIAINARSIPNRPIF